MKITRVPRRSLNLRLGVGFSHSSKSGGPVLRGHTSIRTINGFWINTPSRQVWVELWRHA